jgi:DNA polymerase-4
VARLPKVGAKTAARLADLGARRVADLLELGAARLEEELGNHGLRILEMARGQDRSPVRVAALPKSIGRETTFPEPTAEFARLAAEAEKVAESVAAALDRQGLTAGRVALRLIATRGAATTRSVTLREPALGAREIYRVALELLLRSHDPGVPQRGLGITLAGLRQAAGEDRQLDLFGPRRGTEGRLKDPDRGSERF